MQWLHRTSDPEAVAVFRNELIVHLEAEQRKVSNASARHKFYQEVIDMLHGVKLSKG